ncbi:MAG: hypothetical protein H7287_12875 [Thermoleophilia bacterium]|nr:hypothetical protein [Thermoleophilia bacterium]
MRSVGHALAKADGALGRSLQSVETRAASTDPTTAAATLTLAAEQARAAAQAVERVFDEAHATPMARALTPALGEAIGGARRAAGLLDAGQTPAGVASFGEARRALRTASESMGVDLDAALAQHGAAAVDQLDVAPATARKLLHGPSDQYVQGAISAQLPDLQVGTRGNGLTNADQGVQLRTRVRNELGDIFAPLADDLVSNARTLRDMPLDQLPMAGESGVTGRYEGLRVIRYLKMRVDVAGGSKLLRRMDTKVESRQQVPGQEHIHGLDLVVPVGDYGEPMARALVNAGRVLDAVAINTLRPAADALTAKHAGTLADWTFQKDSLNALVEGIGTFAGTTGLLTSKRIAGVSGDELLGMVEQSHLLDRAAKGPLGLAGPMFFKGWGPQDPVRLVKGRLKLGDGFDELEKATRARRQTNTLITTPQTRQTHKGCPIVKPRQAVEHADGEHTNPETYITSIGREYLHLARRFYAAEIAKVGQAAS